MMLKAFLILATLAQANAAVCLSASRTFTVKVNLFAGELGYFQFEECGDMISPTILMEIGETYTFIQSDITNFFHPMGFAYFPDGAHNDLEELEPGIPPTEGNNCAETNSCPAPMYFLNNKYLGKYNNDPDLGDLTVDEEDFGLDFYEPLFFHPIEQWIEYGEFSVKLRFDDEDFPQDIFYFCHIHQFMTGRIKLMRGMTLVSENRYPKLGYEYDEPGSFDQECGTFGLDAFQYPSDNCPERFVCGTDEASDSLQTLSACIDAMNCKMFKEMRTQVTAGSENALFMHQMIPHHVNAVNMAKAMLKSGSLSCDDPLAGTENCILLRMMYDIVNDQNFQIQVMNNLLEANPDYPLTDSCEPAESYRSLQIKAPPDNDRALYDEGSICTSENNIFTVKVNLFAGETGYFQFEECGDQISPTIGLEIGKTYTFVQSDITNYYHPMGFAYFPDGAHNDLDELEPGVTRTGGNSCAKSSTCPAPMYFLNGEYLGKYNNIPNTGDLTVDEDDFGLDSYEPLFFHPIVDWVGYGKFSIKLRFDDEDYTDDLFYFCHIHELMSGRIKLLKDGEAVNEEDTPELGYEYDEPGEFDEQCGTYNLDAFQLPMDSCPENFVCDTEDAPENVQLFSLCIDAMNCHMLNGMGTGVESGSENALFMHQMIPHHQNAVNMAKALIKSGSLDCDDISEETEDCVLTAIMYAIINNQNYQIHTMRTLLEENPDYLLADDCDDGSVVAASQILSASSSITTWAYLLTAAVAFVVFST